MEETNRQPEQWMTTAEVAELARVSVSCVSNWFRTGRLPGRELSPRVRRFRRADVEEFMGDRVSA